MLERPDVEDTALVACLEQAFGLRVADIAFLPIGADPNAAAFRVVAEGGTVYFFKLRSGASNEVAVSLPRWLQEQGISQVIAPLLPTNNGRLWDSVDGYTVILYPYVEGRNGYEVPLSDQHWRELGAALRRLHAVAPPPALLRSIRRESYSPLWCERVRMMLDLVVANTWPEPVTARLATFLNSQRSQTLDLVERTERLARVLRSDSPEFVLCHSDIHAGNVLIDSAGALYVVDWDDPIMAPKERDLMFAGGGLMGGWRTPQKEEAPFYEGYGPTQIDRVALAYYRYARIVEDIALYCEQILLTDESSQDRELAFRYLTSNYLPDNTIEIAIRSDTTLMHG